MLALARKKSEVSLVIKIHCPLSFQSTQTIGLQSDTVKTVSLRDVDVFSDIA